MVINVSCGIIGAMSVHVWVIQWASQQWQVDIGKLTLAIDDFLAIANADAANGILWWPMLVDGGNLS